MLPGKHRFSILRAFHESMHHADTDFVVIHVKQHFLITSGRKAIKRVRNDFIPCQRLRQIGRPTNDGRCTSCVSWCLTIPVYLQVRTSDTSTLTMALAFQNAGEYSLRFFLFFLTVLVTQAVNVHMAISLSTNDFLMVLRRFVSAYGKPAHICLDNGTTQLELNRFSMWNWDNEWQGVMTMDWMRSVSNGSFCRQLRS